MKRSERNWRTKIEFYAVIWESSLFVVTINSFDFTAAAATSIAYIIHNNTIIMCWPIANDIIETKISNGKSCWASKRHIYLEMYISTYIVLLLIRVSAIALHLIYIHIERNLLWHRLETNEMEKYTSVSYVFPVVFSFFSFSGFSFPQSKEKKILIEIMIIGNGKWSEPFILL